MPADVFQPAESDAIVGVNPDHQVLLAVRHRIGQPAASHVIGNVVIARRDRCLSLGAPRLVTHRTREGLTTFAGCLFSGLRDSCGAYNSMSRQSELKSVVCEAIL